MMAIKDVMNDFLESSIQEVDLEYIEIEEKYQKLFGHTVPRLMLPPGITTDAIKSAMLESIESGEDNVMERLGVKINSNYIY